MSYKIEKTIYKKFKYTQICRQKRFDDFVKNMGRFDINNRMKILELIFVNAMRMVLITHPA